MVINEARAVLGKKAVHAGCRDKYEYSENVVDTLANIFHSIHQDNDGDIEAVYKAVGTAALHFQAEIAGED